MARIAPQCTGPLTRRELLIATWPKQPIAAIARSSDTNLKTGTQDVVWCHKVSRVQ